LPGGKKKKKNRTRRVGEGAPRLFWVVGGKKTKEKMGLIGESYT